jgi:anti-anti-sigma factor
MDPPKNVFEIETVEQTLIVTPQGDSSGFRYNDIHTEFNRLRQLLGDPDVKNLVVDLRHVSHLGSLIIGAIVRTVQHVNFAGGRAALCCLSIGLEDELKRSRLDKLLPQFPSRDEALASVREIASPDS